MASGPKKTRIGKRKRGNTGGSGRSGSIKELPLAGQTAFYDGGKTDQMRTTETWENKRKDLDHEQLLMTNKDGFAIGYFDGDKGSVAFRIPKGYTTDAKRSEIVLTHVHPAVDDRTIGGGFSDADVTNHIMFGFGETRAVSVEGTYSFKTTTESDSKGFLKALSGRESDVYPEYFKALSSMKQQGYTLTPKEETDLYLRVSDAWYRNTAYKYGYEYKSPWG